MPQWVVGIVTSQWSVPAVIWISLSCLLLSVNFSHVALMTAASALLRTHAVTLTARASKQILPKSFQNAEQRPSPSCFYISPQKMMHTVRFFFFFLIKCSQNRAKSHGLSAAESCVSELKAWRGFGSLCEGHSVCLCCVPPHSKWLLKG